MCVKMASISKYGKGYRAAVARKGVRRTKVFPTRQEAKDWAARQEYLILNADTVASATPLKDVLDRYAREVSTTKRGERWEVLRLANIAKHTMARKAISEIRPSDIADWRDKRLDSVSGESVRREMNLLSAVFTQARREWGMISVSPMAEVRKPPASKPRDRRPTADEIDRIGLVAGTDLTKGQGRAWAAFLFAIETGMRAGEILSLSAATVNTEARVADLPMTKNGTARRVPLSRRAVEIWASLPGDGFQLTSAQLDALWRKVRDKAGVEGLRFHDSRAEAATRLAKKVDVLTLAKILGHRDLRMLQVYYRETAEDIAKRLD